MPANLRLYPKEQVFWMRWSEEVSQGGPCAISAEISRAQVRRSLSGLGLG
jgi:hypothetical protein